METEEGERPFTSIPGRQPSALSMGAPPVAGNLSHIPRLAGGYEVTAASPRTVFSPSEALTPAWGPGRLRGQPSGQTMSAPGGRQGQLWMPWGPAGLKVYFSG